MSLSFAGHYCFYRVDFCPDQINNMDLIISGTNRPDSNSLKVAVYYQKQLESKGVSLDLLSLMDLPSDLIVSDMYGRRSEAFQLIQDRVLATEKLIFIIPEYNGGMPGVLKSFIDACKFPESFLDKKAALVGLGAGRHGNLRGLEHFTGIANHFNLHVMPMKIYLPSIHTELDQEGNFSSDETRAFVDSQINKFIRY